MPLWGNTDIEASRPKFIDVATLPAGTNLVFVDATESMAASNKTKGIKVPGWYMVREWQDNAGTVRYQSDCIVAMSSSVTQAVAGDANDDTLVPDVNTVVGITVQPVDRTTTLGAATFTVTAAFTSGTGTLTYQWQRRINGGQRWTNVTGATAASLALTAQTTANTGDQYRVNVAGAGSRAVTSDAAILTFGT